MHYMCGHIQLCINIRSCKINDSRSWSAEIEILMQPLWYVIISTSDDWQASRTSIKYSSGSQMMSSLRLILKLNSLKAPSSVALLGLCLVTDCPSKLLTHLQALLKAVP